MVEIEFNILFYENNNNLIKPSDITYNNDFQIVCYLKIKDEHVYSIPNIHRNKYFNCIENFNINENPNIGIKIYKFDREHKILNNLFFFEYYIDYNNFYYNNNNKFDPLFIENKYISLNSEILDFNKKNNETLKLKNSYIKKPFCSSKIKYEIIRGDWSFSNIYNNYFCFCKGTRCLYNISQICKYKFFLSIIDNNRYLYNKTEYLLADFLGNFQSSDDAYPIFKELIKNKKKAYYMSKNKDIYKKHCKNIKKCKLIIKSTYINGNFLEKYFEIFLRLKAVIAGSEFYSIDNIFYNIEYITYICLTHGINYFKTFLYNDYYSYSRYNKLVTSNSNKIISLAKKYGWKEENIIKICFPKWDKYNTYKESYITKIISKEHKSIFIFFTWRNWKNQTNKLNINSISSYYFKNIFRLLYNNLLIKEIKKNNLTLYFSLHQMFEKKYKKKLKIKKFIKFVNQRYISKCLMKTNLIITDFSSIIFDMIFQRKPYIMFIPDSDDPNIFDFYDLEYCNLINDLRNEKIYFENKFFKINEVIKKIIHYINNDFKLEENLIKFYDTFEFNCRNNTQRFFDYLENLK